MIVYLSTDEQQCASNWKYLTGFLGIDESPAGAKELQPRKDKRMCLGLAARPIQLSTVKVEKGSLSLKCVCVCMCICTCIVCGFKKKNGQLSLFCKSIVWHKDGKGSHSPLVLPLYEEQTVLISVTHTRSTLQPTGKVQQQQQQCLPRLQNK